MAVRPWNPAANTSSPTTRTAESISTSRSSSVRPCGEASVVSHTVSPVASDTAITLPLSKPLMANSLAMTGIAVPRKLKRGTCCSTCQSSLPLSAANPCSRPSTERMTTTFSPIAGADSNSEFTCVRHRSLPVAASSATIAPLLEPTTIIPKPAAGPADSGNFSFFTHCCLPVSRTTAATSPLCDAAKTKPLSIAGPRPKRNLICFLPPPTLSSHSFFTGSVAGNLSRAAGGSTSLSLEHPAVINSVARPTRSSKRIRV